MTSQRDNRISNYRCNVITLLEEIERRDAENSGQRAEIACLKDKLNKAKTDSATQPVTMQTCLEKAKPKGRAAVVCWDLGHNPAGRAVVIHDLLAQEWEVDLVGPVWDRYGDEVWSPIANSNRSILSFKASRFEDFYPKALGFAAGQVYDLVVVVKPRLPGLLLGGLIQKASRCPIVLDIDDFELSFFKNKTPASLDELEAAGAAGLDLPYEELATRACESVICHVRSKTVSNVALRARYGGMLVRHARDEELFDPARCDRAKARRALGVEDTDFAIVFVGTPRPHKGIYDVAKALHEMEDKRFVLHIIGAVKDQAMRDILALYDKARIVYHPNCEMHDLPEKLAAADALALLQDPDHPISQYQIPAKVSDGAAFGHPILATNVPPLRDLFPLGILRETKRGAQLKQDLAALMRARISGEARHQRQTTRAGFVAELGHQVNGLRLSFAIKDAKEALTLPKSMDRLLRHAQTMYSLMRLQAHAPSSPPILRHGAPDVVAFWKQNDSKLFGRRCDMLLSHLQASGVVGRILRFDAPQPMQAMHRLVTGQNQSPQSVDYLVQQNMIDDQFGLRDTDMQLYRTYLYGDKTLPTGALPDVGKSQADVVTYVRRQMHELGIDPYNSIAWVCPIVFDFPAISQAIPFKRQIADLIDDQRTFPMQENYRQRIVQSYEACLPLFDTVLTNCQPMVTSFAGIRSDIRVVPNGAEVPEDVADISPMRAILRYGSPIIGYVGNLRDRFDWSLLAATAARLPDARFVIVGGGAREEDTDIVKTMPNVYLHGPVPYDQVQRCIRAFDVAIMPHEKSDQTSRMNPLKIYNYVALQRPIVTTHVGNIDDALMPYLRFADGPEAFAAAIEAALHEPLTDKPGFAEAVASISWEKRAAAVAEYIV
ncbi:MAG: glycosyltransferase [Pseudomonadota bacterium]